MLIDGERRPTAKGLEPIRKEDEEKIKPDKDRIS